MLLEKDNREDVPDLKQAKLATDSMVPGDDIVYGEQESQGGELIREDTTPSTEDTKIGPIEVKKTRTDLEETENTRFNPIETENARTGPMKTENTKTIPIEMENIISNQIETENTRTDLIETKNTRTDPIKTENTDPMETENTRTNPTEPMIADTTLNVTQRPADQQRKQRVDKILMDFLQINKINNSNEQPSENAKQQDKIPNPFTEDTTNIQDECQKIEYGFPTANDMDIENELDQESSKWAEHSHAPMNGKKANLQEGEGSGKQKEKLANNPISESERKKGEDYTDTKLPRYDAITIAEQSKANFLWLCHQTILRLQLHSFSIKITF